MNPYRFLSALLLLSAVFLATGAMILRFQDLVPLTLTYATFVVILLILTVAHFNWHENFSAALLGIVLAAVSIVFNLLQPAHTSAILHPFGTVIFEILVVSEVSGFFLLPAVYIIYFLARYRKLRTFSALSKIHS